MSAKILHWPTPDEIWWRPVVMEMRRTLPAAGINPALAEVAVAEVRDRLAQLDLSFTIDGYNAPDECVPFITAIGEQFLAGYRKVSDKFIAEMLLATVWRLHAERGKPGPTLRIIRTIVDPQNDPPAAA